MVDHLFLDGEFIANVPQCPGLRKEKNPGNTALESRERR
jgi:hypothetical protein